MPSDLSAAPVATTPTDATQTSRRAIDGGAPPGGALSIAARLFAWLNIALIAAFMADNMLMIVFGWPGGGAALEGDADYRAFIQLGGYAVAAAMAVWYVLGTADRSLRIDAKTTHDANCFIIRAAFWAVLFVGFVDAAISFLRVEGLLPAIVGEELATALGRPQYRGPMVHVPLMLLGVLAAMVTRTLGFLWLATLIVLAELLIVLTRFIFSYEQAFMGDLVRFWYAALFLFASAYTLFEDGHVRVDVFYAGMSPRGKGLVNAVGCILLGLTLCWTIILIGFAGKTGIINSAISTFEVSQSGFGMYIKYMMAGFLGVFAITMAIQFCSYLMEAIADYRGEAGHREASGGAAA